ncbi:hypothetical protein IWX78_000824 [Mycetocola sp. CAN_C7]
MSNHVPTWPARAGVPGLILWTSVVVALGAGGWFLFTILTGS